MAGNRNGALASARHALAINVCSPNAFVVLAILLSFAGEAAEANDLFGRTLDLAPAHYARAPFLAYMALNWLRLGSPDRGLSYAEEAVRLKPEIALTHIARAAVLAAIGRTDDARAALLAAIRHRPDLDWTVVDAMIPYSDPADAERLHQVLHVAGLEHGRP
jgi:tetratricopeptide (TPR) repeat protein